VSCMNLLSQPDCTDIDGSIHHLSQHESDSALNMPSKYNTGMLKKTEGTWCFWSPEMCSTNSDESKGFSGYAADLWAAGVCLYIFTTGRLPFFSLSPSDLFHLIAKAEVQYEGLDLSHELKDLLGKLLTKDPATRAGVGDCLKHKFCASARTQRIHELGSKIKGSERQIVLSKNDVDMALSVFKSQRHASLVGSALMANNNIVHPASMSVTTSSPRPVGVPAPQAYDLRTDSNLTKSTIEISMEPKDEANSSTTPKKSRLSITNVGKTMRNIFNCIRNVELENK
jgi:serine/threonine protein kinase